VGSADAGRSFSALAQFPAAASGVRLNRVRERWRCLPAGQRHHVQWVWSRFADSAGRPEAIRRAVANLIDNAAEAMQGSLLRVLAFTAR